MLEHQPHAESRSGQVANNLPGSEPVGVEGCMTCAALSHSREVALEAAKLPIATVWGVAV